MDLMYLKQKAQRQVFMPPSEHVEVVVIKMPVPPQFYSQLTDEAGFDDELSRFVASRGVPFHDFSAKTSEPSLYFDTDHLSRAGLTQFFFRDLKPVLVSGEDVSRPVSMTN